MGGDLCGCVFFVSVIAFEDVNFLVDVLFAFHRIKFSAQRHSFSNLHQFVFCSAKSSHSTWDLNGVILMFYGRSFSQSSSVSAYSAFSKI